MNSDFRDLLSWVVFLAIAIPGIFIILKALYLLVVWIFKKENQKNIMYLAAVLFIMFIIFCSFIF